MYTMDRKCPVNTTMSFMGKRWTILVLLALYKGKAKWKRYSHVKKALPGITPKVLSMRLKELEKEKLVSHRLDREAIPAKSSYALTRSGMDFVGVIRAIKEWGLKWKVRNEHCESMDCKECDF